MSTRGVGATLVAVLATAALSGCDDEPQRAAPDPGRTSTSTSTSAESATPEPARPTLDGDGWLVYETSAYTIAFVRTDGTGSAAPGIDDEPPSPQDNPDWSPDGTRITFVSRDGLWVMDADGSDASVVVPTEEPSYVDDPSWSPDGSTIAFSHTVVRGDRGTSTLETVTIADGTTEVVAGPWRDAFTGGVTWSPDGARLVYEWGHLPRPSLDADLTSVDLALLTLRTGEVVTVLDPARFPETADWSPDGRWIAIGYRPTPGADAGDLYLVRPDGSDLRRVTTLTDRGGFATHPSFTTDSGSLVFSGARHADDSAQLFRVTIDGGRPQPLGDRPVFGSHPKVRPES